MATAAGVYATSAVVNITVVSQVLASPPNFAVTTPGGEFEYVVNGASSGLTASNANVDDSLNFTLNAGATYIFSMSTSGNHPVDICTNPDTFSFYVGASAQAVHAGTVTVTIPATNYPATLYYICNVHTFYGAITVAPPQPPPPVSILQTSVATNIVLTFSGGTNTIQLTPQFSSNPFWTVPQAAKSAPILSAKSRSQPLQLAIGAPAMASSRSGGMGISWKRPEALSFRWNMSSNTRIRCPSSGVVD